VVRLYSVLKKAVNPAGASGHSLFSPVRNFIVPVSLPAAAETPRPKEAPGFVGANR
jgi:hypothetical protein